MQHKLRINMTDEELKQLVASLAIKSDKLDAQIASLFVSQKETNEQMKRTDEKLERMGITLGNISRNQGDVAEEFFYNSLAEDTRLGSIRFDDISKNEQKRRGTTEEEYDIVMTNGDAVGIVEVKYKAHQNDLQKLERKMHNFKKLFPVYRNYKLYGALASFHINKDAKKESLQRGFFVLQRAGKVIQTECGQELLVL